MATYVNDLRLKEIATGDESGTWGTSTNTNLELIGEALGYGSQDCFSSDANATTTVADGATDPARAMYFKVTSSATLSATRELTIAPNTVSRVMVIENATTGSQIITIKQGSGNTVNVANGAVKVLYLDGVGAGAAVQDALVDLDLTGTTSAVNLDISGNVDIDGTTNLDAVDIDGAVQIDSTVTVGVDDTGYDVKFFGATASAYMLWDESADDLILAGAARVVVPASGLVIGSTAVTSTAAELNVLDPALKENNSIWIGSDPSGTTDTSSYNVAIGVSALDAVTTSGYNVAVGGEAMGKTTTGDLNVAVGYKALTESTVGDRNTAVGYECLRDLEPASKTDMYNVALGFKAGTNASAGTDFTGIQNVLLGSFAGAEITSGSYNSHVGYNAGGGAAAAAHTGNYNSAFGRHALSAIQGAAAGNTALGFGALETLTTASNNVAVGGAAMQLLSTGADNVAVGYQAGEKLSVGDQNTYVGNYAGEEATTAEYNAVVGYNAGGGGSSEATGNYNSALGYAALQNTTTGASNVAIGGFAMQSITEGDSCVAVGYQALDANTTGTDNVAIGRGALGANVDDSGSVAVGRDSLRVANNTGSTGVSYNTALGTNSGYNVTLGTQNTLLGYSSGFGLTEGVSNSVLGINAGYGLTTGDNNLFLGKDAGRTGSPGGNITTGDNEIVLGDENISEAHIQVDWTVASDARDKTDFTALDLGLDFVKALKPVTYKWDRRSKYGDKTAADYDLNAQTPDGTHKEDWLDIGFKAQEVEALEIAAGYNKDNKTNLVSSHSGDGNQMGLQYSKFVPILVKAVQEQQALIESLTSRIAALES